MTGLIIIFSALGGTTGSLITGRLTDVLNTHDAFYFPLIPIALLALMLLPYKRLADRTSDGGSADGGDAGTRGADAGAGDGGE
jgi:hypothetical protein